MTFLPFTHTIYTLIIAILSHELYKHSKVLYICVCVCVCVIALLLLYTSKRYQKDCGWPLEYKSLSIYIFCFLLTLFYLFLLFHNKSLLFVIIIRARRTTISKSTSVQEERRTVGILVRLKIYYVMELPKRRFLVFRLAFMSMTMYHLQWLLFMNSKVCWNSSKRKSI